MFIRVLMFMFCQAGFLFALAFVTTVICKLLGLPLPTCNISTAIVIGFSPVLSGLITEIMVFRYSEIMIEIMTNGKTTNNA